MDERAEGKIAALENPDTNIYALQYHPEVTHSEHGTEALRHLLLNVCRHEIPWDWHLGDVLTETVRSVARAIGPNDHVLCGFSGGVDSMVAATLVHRAIGDRLRCVFIDNSWLRYKEGERVMATFEAKLHLPVTCINTSA